MAVNRLVGPGLAPLDGRLVYVSDPQPEQSDATIEFRQLQYFVSVAEELHFGRAASRMFISQPALSQAIAGLERALDVQLLVRTRHNVELTEAGAELLRHARGLLADRDDAVDGVRRIGRGEAGVLRVGVALLAEPEVAPALAALTAAHPELVLDRFAALSERLLASVRDRALNAAFVHQLPLLATFEDVEWEVIRRSRLAALVSCTSELANRDSVTLSELSYGTFLVPPRELAPSAFEGLQTMCRTYGEFEPTVLEVSTSSLPFGADWRPIVDGDAVALMGEATARAARPAGTAVLPIRRPPAFALAMAWRRGNSSPILQRFLTFMRTYRDVHAWDEDPTSSERA